MKRNAYERLLFWKKSEHHATLEVSGARQVGKTYIVNKFADEQYQHKIYINLLDFTGELFLERYEELRNEILHGLQYANPVYELIKRAYPDFVDSSDTVVIIDEIQESADIYNRIREFTREFLETPAFATLEQGEIDFYVKSLKTQKTYAIEVEAGKKNSKTVQMILEKEKADYVIYAKGNTHGGIKDNVHTIPIYGIGKYDF